MKTLAPFFNQFTDNQLKEQLKHNANQLNVMADKAKITGKYRGATESYLRERADHYKSLI